MKLKELIKKLLGHKREYTSALSSLNDCIPILSREIFEGDKEKIKYLEDIKKEYSDILTKKRTVLSIDLNTSNLYGQMNMYIEMLHNLLDVEEVDNSFEKAFYYNDGTKKINMMIKMSKLKLYYRRIEKLAIEANVRRMALKEIFDEKLFLSSKKKNSIKEEMNHLAGTLLVYTNQIQTIKLQIDSYLMNYETLGNEEFVERDIETELLNKKQEELKQMIEAFMIEDKRDIENCDNDFLTIAFMEEALSKYIYEHKKVEVEKLREEIISLQKEMKVFITIESISKVEKLEIKVKALSLYGHNIVDNQDMDSFYHLKFMAITDVISYDYESHLAEECNFIELECYGKIIMEKISSLLQEQNPLIGDPLAIEVHRIVIEALKTVLKNEDNEFSFIDILNDNKKLGFLLAMDTENYSKLEEYFHWRTEPMEKYSSVNLPEKILKFSSTFPLEDISDMIFHKRILEFRPILSLATIYDMIYYNDESISEPLYLIYKMIKNKQRKSREFHFPDGLTRINISDSNLSVCGNENKFINNIRQLCLCKDVIFPPSLCELSGPLFTNMVLESVNFFNGITKISNKVFFDATVKRITFPPSLTTIEGGAFEYAQVVELCFKNYKNSNLDEASQVYLVEEFFKVEKADDFCMRVPDWMRDEQRMHREESCHWYSNPNIVVLDTWHTKYEFVPTFAKLILTQNDFLENEEIIITKEELKINYDKRWQSHPRNSRIALSNLDYEIILDELKRVIKIKIEKEKTKKLEIK